MARGRPGQGTLALGRGEVFPAIFLFLGREWWQREQVMRQGYFKKGWDKWGEKRRDSVSAVAGEMEDCSHVAPLWPGT